MKKIIEIIAKVMSFIGAVPAWILPDKLKGYRTQFYLIISTIVGMLAVFTDMIPKICELLNGVGISCNTEMITAVLIALATSMGANLREKTNTPVFVKENAAGK